jgi:PAS domain S-box-containing protein
MPLPSAKTATELAEEFFRRAPLGMAILRLEDPRNPATLRIVALNPAAPIVSDVPTAAVGKRIDQDYPAIAQTPFPAQIAEVMRTGQAANLGEGPGTYDPSRHFTLTAFPIPPDCVGLLFEDITERRKEQRLARESELRYRKIFDASTAAICLFESRTGTLIDANPRFVEMIGLGASSQLIGKRLESFGMWAGEGEYAKVLEQLRKEHSIREANVTYRTFGGQVRRALVALELFEVEGLECILGIFWRV